MATLSDTPDRRTDRVDVLGFVVCVECGWTLTNITREVGSAEGTKHANRFHDGRGI